MAQGTAVFDLMTPNEQIVARFMVKFLRLDENDCHNVFVVYNIIKKIGVN